MSKQFFMTMLEISITTGAMILIVMLLSSFLNKTFMSKCKYFIWLIIAVRLIIPINITLEQAPVSIVMPTVMTEEREIGSAPIAEIVQTTTYINTTTVSANTKPSENLASSSITLLEIVTLVWIIGALSFLLYHFVGYYIFRKQIMRWSRFTEEQTILDTLSVLSVQMEIKRPIDVLISEKVAGPLIIGLFRPVLVLPDENYRDGDLAFIIKHELTHYKRHDLWYKLLLVIATAIHWFNPLVWLMFAEASKDIELSCDDEVTKGMDVTERTAYSESIMQLINTQKMKKVALTTYFYGGTESMKERFKNIFDMRKKFNSLSAVATAFILVLVSSTMVGFVLPEVIIEKEGNINLNVIGCHNVKVITTTDNKVSYDIELDEGIDPDKYSFTLEETDDILYINLENREFVKNQNSGSNNNYNNNDKTVITISIPDKAYETFKVKNQYSGVLISSGIDADFILVNEYGSMSIDIGQSFSRNLRFDNSYGSGNIKLGDATDNKKDYLESASTKEDFILVNDFGSMNIDIEKPFSRNLRFDNNFGSGNIKLSDDIKDYTLNIKSDYTASISLPNSFPKARLGQPYNYTGGNGKPTITVDVSFGSFSFRA